MKFYLKLFLSCIILSGALRASAPSDEALIYDGGRALPSGWTLDTWGGVVAEVDASAIGSVCIYPKKEQVQPWAGAWMHTIAETIPGLPLPERRDGERPLYLNLKIVPDRDRADGRFAVPIQVALFVNRADGTAGSTAYRELRPHHVGREADRSGTKWDLFSVPLEKLSSRQAGEIVSISGVYFQYASDSPLIMGFHVGKISISPVPHDLSARPATGTAAKP